MGKDAGKRDEPSNSNSATSQSDGGSSKYDASDGLSPLDWLTLNEPTNQQFYAPAGPTWGSKLFQNPIIPIGLLASFVAICVGVSSIGKRPGRSQNMLRLRVGSSGLVLCAIVYDCRNRIDWNISSYFHRRRNSILEVFGKADGDEPVFKTELNSAKK